ncbi:MAG: signal peptidase II [Actinobacteria bacterium]|nr:signal peptidase II [Actinomycetota bacterium]NBR66077.1 signal peptidase II [Actinomycetota bacterium]
MPAGVAVVALDQVTKTWAVNALDDGRTIDLFWTLRLALGFNSGMAFSKATGLGPFIGIVATLAIVFIVASMRRAESAASAFGMVLVAAGAAGNVIDRLFRGDAWFRGSVVDFIDLQWWPVFNVADSAITVGGVLVIIAALRARDAGADDAVAAGGGGS